MLNIYSPFKDLIKAYLESKRDTLEHNTYRSRVSLASFYFKPFYDIPINNITKNDITNLFNKIKSRGLSSNYLYVISSFINQIFLYAEHNDLLDNNPCSDLKLIVRDRSLNRPKMLRDDDLLLIQRAAKSEPFGNLFMFILLTGISLQDALAIGHSDVDYLNNTISIKKTIKFKPTDTLLIDAKRKRKVFISNDAIYYLLREALVQASNEEIYHYENTHNLIFTNNNGSLFKRSNIDKGVANFKKKTNLSHFNITSLKNHYIAVALNERDIDFIQLSKNLGYKNAHNLMLRLYASQRDL